MKMELEFDKEIDAILRRGRRGLTCAATGEHLDADVVAAFAEGAVPERARPLYTRHLADCERCRKFLAQAIAMNTAAPLAADGAASSTASAVSESASWLSNLFRTPGFAVAMGVLVLVFGGALGFMVLRNQQSGDAATVSQSDTEMQKGGPSAGIELNEQIPNSNAASTAANTAANAAVSNTAASAATNSAVGASPREGELSGSVASRSVENLPTNERNANNFVLDGATLPEPKPGAAAPPPPVTTDTTVSERDRDKLKSDDKEAKQAKDENVLLGGMRQETEDRRARGDVAKAKKAPSGPTRSGPVQSQNQVNTQTYEMPVTRNAGGKKFTNRNGAWYDTAYRGQATTNVRRGTDAYKKLDDGVRSIADALGGTVIVVWKDKAYRIQ